MTNLLNEDQKHLGSAELVSLPFKSQDHLEFLAPYGAKILRGAAIPKSLGLAGAAAALVAAYNSGDPSIAKSIKKRREAGFPGKYETFPMPGGDMIAMLSSSGALYGTADDVMADLEGL